MSNEAWNDEGIECPCCGNVSEPDDAMDYSEDEVTQHCGSCGKEFTFSCFVTHSWTSKKIEK